VQHEPFSVNDFVTEMERLLAACPEQQQLRNKLLYDFGAAAMVENVGWNYRDWLRAMSARVQKVAGHPRAS
jgi:hypothetical protein